MSLQTTEALVGQLQEWRFRGFGIDCWLSAPGKDLVHRRTAVSGEYHRVLQRMNQSIRSGATILNTACLTARKYGREEYV